MAVSLAKLTAGSGYAYLTRQVASGDTTRPTGTELGDYYSEKGEKPGQWLGEGLRGLDGVSSGDAVTEDQMAALFGEGLHPNAKAIIEAHIREEIEAGRLDPQHSEAIGAESVRAARLGQQYHDYESSSTDFVIGVMRAYQRYNEHPEERAAYGATPEERGEDPADDLPEGRRPRATAVPEKVRRLIRTQVGRDTFEATYGRLPVDSRELASHIARQSRPARQRVSGYDLTFSPVKSVSALWALAPREIAEQIEQAHTDAVRDVIRWAEDNVLHTRRGTDGVRSTDVTGAVATAFTHRDARSGDPDLHTHVALSAKVQDAVDDQWRAIDGTLLYKATVSMSERYNSVLEEQLRARLGLSFAPREATDRGSKRAVREVVGVPADLITRWSTRRQDIERRMTTLSGEFAAVHGRAPTPKEAIALRQQANLETRQGKHEARSEQEQRDVWRQEAVAVLGENAPPESVVAACLAEPSVGRVGALSDAEIGDLAGRVVHTLEVSRSRFQPSHVRAEAERRVRDLDLAGPQARVAAEQIVAAALYPERAVRIDAGLEVQDAPALRRKDGLSVYERPLMRLYTTQRITAAEDRIIAAARRDDGRTVGAGTVAAALMESTANGVTLNPAQAQMVTDMATRPERVQLALAPAGSGKTTSLRVLATAWRDSGGRVIGLAPSANAAAELRDATGVHSDTLAKLIWHLEQPDDPPPLWMSDVGPDTLVLVDEAGMASTLHLDSAIAFAISRGATVRLVGDDQQLAAIGAGGVLRDVAAEVGATSLSELVRFSDPAEGQATLRLRSGQADALGYYLDRGRVHAVPEAAIADQAYAAWRAAADQGQSALILAHSTAVVDQLNDRARADRVAAGVVDPAKGAVRLFSGLHASPGDVVVTRRNDRRRQLTATDFVKNGDRWVVESVSGGSMTVRHERLGRTVTLDRAYSAEHVDLGYASTIHGAQGQTVDSSHVMVTGDESRQLLYVAMSRGRHLNEVYVPVGTDGDEHQAVTPAHTMPRTAVEVLEEIIARDGQQISARSEIQHQNSPGFLLHRAVGHYQDSLRLSALSLVGPERMDAITRAAERAVPGVTDAPSWDILAGHLAVVSLNGIDPVEALSAAAKRRSLHDARDLAAVLDWRLDTSQNHGASTGPLSWLPGIPALLSEHHELGPALIGRREAIRRYAVALAEEVTTEDDARPRARWERELAEHPQLLAKAAVWRAVNGVPDEDLSTLGPPPPATRPRRYYDALSESVTVALGIAAPTDPPAWWIEAVGRNPQLSDDTFSVTLRDRLVAASSAGIDVENLVTQALSEGSLPDEHAASSLWFRLAPHLSPVAAADDVAGVRRLRPDWTDHLTSLLTAGDARSVLTSPQWPLLVAAVQEAVRETGASAEQLLTAAVGAAHLDAPGRPPADSLATVIAWRVHEEVSPQLPESDVPSPVDLHDQELEAFAQQLAAEAAGAFAGDSEPPLALEPPDHIDGESDDHDIDLEAFAAQLAARDLSGVVIDVHADAAERFGRITRRAEPLPGTSTTPERVRELTAAAGAFYAARYAGSPAERHLTERFGSLEGVPVLLGYAPSGWTETVDYLRAQHGATDTELVEAGLATESRRGLIDAFRDRAILGIRDVDGVLVGFTGRDLSGHPKAPKYKNTATTAAFTKGSVVFGLHEATTSPNPRLVVVEGAMDALAITVASGGSVHGVSPMGTAMTARQADLITAASADEVWLALDHDAAGYRATAKQHALLADRGLVVRDLPYGPHKDPADAFAADRERLAFVAGAAEHTGLAVLGIATRLIDDARTELTSPDTAEAATRRVQGEIAPHLAAIPPSHWPETIAWLSSYWPYPSDRERDRSATWDQMTMYDATLLEAIRWELPRSSGGHARPAETHAGVSPVTAARTVERITAIAGAVADGRGHTALSEDELAKAMAQLARAAASLDGASERLRDTRGPADDDPHAVSKGAQRERIRQPLDVPDAADRAVTGADDVAEQQRQKRRQSSSGPQQSV